MAENPEGLLFDGQYYQHSCGEPYARNEVWMSYFRSVAQKIASEIQPKSVLDAGCAWGFLVENLRLEGIEAFGVDISEYAIQKAHADIKPYVWVGSVADPFPRKYDLIVSIEVLEHMPREQAEKAIENFSLHTDDILFSSTPLDFKEATHFNVQPPEYWAERFALQGFFQDVDFDAIFLTPWASRYRRKQEPIHRLVRDYERKYWILKKENSDLRSLVGEMRGQTNEQVIQLQNQVKSWEYRWADLEHSFAWKAITPFRRLRQLFKK